MRRVLPFLLTLLATTAATAGAAPAAGAATAPACLEPTSWVAGTTALCDGSLVYRDYVDDDYGADTGAVNTTSRTAGLAPSAGDQGYPAGQDATADLIRLTLGVEGDRLRVTGLLNALYDARSTVLAVAIDTDGNALTGGGKWGALNVVSKGWDRIATFDTGDPAANTITGTMPLPPGTRWRVQAVTAVRDSGQVMNVAFRGPEEHAAAKGVAQTSDQGSWFEDDQARALRTGDVSAFGQQVDVADLRAGATREPAVGPGLHERVYRSKYTVGRGEGVDVAGVPGRGNGGSTSSSGAQAGFEQTFQYLGHYQPFGIYVPKQAGPHGLQMVFHGSSSVMSGLINQPGMQTQFGEKLNRILVVPEARGQNGFGSDISERDLLDVMDDVQANYPVDAEQVFAGGYSQGGYITYRMAALYPDRFAGAVDWVGFTGDDENGTPAQGMGYTAGAVGNAIDFVGNLRRVPAFMVYAGADELVHAQTAVAMDRAFNATDDVFEFYTHPAAEHLTFAFLDDWRKESADTAGLRLVHDPPRVTYRTAALLDDPAHGIVHDRAYWLSAIRGRAADPKAYVDSDLTSFGCGGTVPVTRTGTREGSDPVPWTSDFRRQTGLRALPRRAALEGTLRNVASLAVDARATCLAGKALAYELTTDGPATLTFSDGRRLAFDKAGTFKGTLAAPDASARRCASARVMRLHLRRARGLRIRTLTVSVNGRRIRTQRGRSRTAKLDLRGLPKRTVRVRLVARGTRRGRRVTVTDARTYHTCARRRR